MLCITVGFVTFSADPEEMFACSDCRRLVSVFGRLESLYFFGCFDLEFSSEGLIHPPRVRGPLSISRSVDLCLRGRCRISGSSVESPPASFGLKARSSGSGASKVRSRLRLV